MAHLVKLHKLDKKHDGHNAYEPVVYNLDTIVSMEVSVKGTHTVLFHRWSNEGELVKETLDEIIELAKNPNCGDISGNAEVLHG